MRSADPLKTSCSAPPMHSHRRRKTRAYRAVEAGDADPCLLAERLEHGLVAQVSDGDRSPRVHDGVGVLVSVQRVGGRTAPPR